MLTHEKLVDLYRELRDENVLSVYLDVDQHDPAERHKWRTRLEQEVSRCRKRLNGTDGEREQFEEAWVRLRERLEDFDAFVPERGWVGFATPDQVWYAENVPVPMPDGVYWDRGIRVAPYVRGLKQERPVVVALLDSQRARIFRYRDGEVREVEDLRADTFLGDLTDVGVRKRASHRTGIRGETSTDQAHRALEVSTERLLKYLSEALMAAAGANGFVVLGGTPEAVTRAAQALPKALRTRVLEQPGLHVDMTDPEVRTAAEEAASTMTKRYQGELLAQVIDAARANGRACLGREDTERALEEMRVDTLLLSRTFIQDRAEAAEAAVGTALAQGAAVEELSDEGAALLDREGGGIAARLRFTIRQDGGGPEKETAGDESAHHAPS